MLVFVFFFLMIRRPPISTRTDTLFPYTTLFRSFARHINPPFAASGRVDSGDPSFVIFAKLSVSGIFERRHITEVRDSVIGRVSIAVIDLSVGPCAVMDSPRDSMGEHRTALYMAPQMTCACRGHARRFSSVFIVKAFA